MSAHCIPPEVPGPVKRISAHRLNRAPNPPSDPTRRRARLLVLCTALLAPLTPATLPASDLNASTLRILCVTPQGGGDPQIGTGSGFVVGRDDGRSRSLVTNWHVVSCTESGGAAAVMLDADTIVETQVVDHDPDRDLALLEAKRPLGRPAVRLASAETVAKGDQVAAWGFPGAADKSGADAFDPSVADGVVGRVLPEPSEPKAARLIQHSANINPGNSGGPLVDAYDRVIGVNTQKSLTAVLTVGPGGEPQVDRVPLGEGIGWAVVTDELLALLDRHKIRYELTRQRSGALADLWHREPLVVTALGLLLLLSATAVALAASPRRRAVLREGMTRALKGEDRREHKGRDAGRAPPEPRRLPPGTPLLRGLAGPYAGAELPLGESPIAIGRDPQMAQLVIPSQYGRVTKRHALIAHDPARRAFTLEDCWSTHGTLVNGAKIPSGAPVVLRRGDRFQLATTEVTFEVDYA